MMSMPKVIRIGLQAYVKLLKAFKTQYFFMMFNSFCLFSRILFMNGISHAYNFKTFIPDSISFINFILESFAFNCAVCKTSPTLLPIEKKQKFNEYTGWSRIIGTETRGCLEALEWMYKKIVLWQIFT